MLRVPNKRIPALILSIVSFISHHAVLRAQLPEATLEFASATNGVVTVPVQNGLDLPATLNGQLQTDIELDSGATSLMSSNVARRLGLRLEGSASLSGFGSNTVPARFAKVDRIAIGGLTLHGVYFAVLDPPLAGSEEFVILGDQLLKHLVVTVDYAGRRITFTEEHRFRYAGTSKLIPMHRLNNWVLIPAEVDGISGMFSIDTGDAWSMEMFSPFVQEHELVRRLGAKFQGYAGSTASGPDHAYYARVHTLKLGELEVHDPIAFLLTDAGGFGASGSSAGNIGTHILRQFTVTFDEPHAALYLEKGPSYGQPDIFNRAGLVLDADPQSLKVMTVLPKSPAAAVGIVEGDRLLAIDGKATTQPKNVAALSEAQGISAFNSPPGTVLRLRVRHDTTERVVSVILKDML